MIFDRSSLSIWTSSAFRSQYWSCSRLEAYPPLHLQTKNMLTSWLIQTRIVERHWQSTESQIQRSLLLAK